MQRNGYGFFQEATGAYSSTRLMAFTCICAAILFGAMTCLGKAGPDGVIITLSFLSAGFGGKLIQKPLEKPPNGGSGHGQAPTTPGGGA